MPLAEALAILRPLAAALDYAHGEKVLHRDVKPGNVKVLPAAEPGGAPRVQLLDFGLAAEVRSSLSRVSRKGHLGSSGTPSYMAPEQWEARPQGPATDQYALAVVAYQMLAGVRPFDADDPDVLRRAVLSRDPDPIPNLPHGANAALLRALAKDSAARFPSCKAFVEALAKGRDASMTRRLRHAGWLAAAFVAVSVVGALRLAPSEDRLEIRFRETVRKGWIGPLFSKRPALETVVPLHWKEIAREADPDEQVWILLKDERKGADNWCIATKGRVADGIRIRGTMRELLDRLSTAGPPKSLPGQSSSSSPRPPTRSHSSSPPTSAGLPTSPPEGADGKSHAEGAGGAPGGRAAPDMPALPPEGSPLEELEAARSRFQSALDARRAGEWPDESEASAFLLAGIASLDGRIVSALEAKEAADREAEAEQLARLEEESLNAARASAKAAKDEEAIRVLQAGAARDAAKAEPYRKWAGEGEFKARFETLDGRKAVLDGCSKAADLSEAQTAAADVRVAADWIADNAAVRGELDELERALDAFAPDLEKAEAARYAPAALYKAKTAREAAAVLRNRSQFGEAKEQFESARKQYEEALASARTARAAAKAKEALVESRAAKIREDWSAVLAAAEKALEWEPDNSDAKALQAEAEKKLRPVWVVSATLPGGAAAAGASLVLGGKTYSLPVSLKLADGKNYGPGEVTWEKDGKIYVGILAANVADWKGEKKAVVRLEERKGPKPGEPIDLGSGVTLEMVPCPGVAPDFWMGKYEVTQEQWKRVMGNNPSEFKGAKKPVETVSWNYCQEFVKKLNDLPAAKESGLTFRLPTEEEWETACRAGAPKSEKYCKLADGTQIMEANLSRVAWFGKEWEDGPTEVGKNREPNAWGLYDMHGNVWEWTQTAGDVLRVYRGGGFDFTAGYCAAGLRDWLSPHYGYRNLGFRLAASGRTAAK